MLEGAETRPKNYTVGAKKIYANICNTSMNTSMKHPMNNVWFDHNLVVIYRYGKFHLTDTDTNNDMLIITDADTDTNKKKTNLPIPIRRKGIHRYQYEKLLDNDTDPIIF